MGVMNMSLLVDTNYNNAISSADYVSRNEKSDHYFGDEYLGHATSRTNSSDKGQRLGIATFGDVGYIAMYADNSTEEDPIVKVGDYEVRIKDVDPNNATRLEMFALLSYMDQIDDFHSVAQSRMDGLKVVRSGDKHHLRKIEI